MMGQFLVVVGFVALLGGMIFLGYHAHESRKEKCRSMNGTWVAKLKWDESYCIEGRPIHEVIK